MGFLIIAMLIIIFGGAILNKLNQIEKRLANTKAPIEQITNNAEILESLNGEIQELLNEGKKIKAVKRVRETMGLSLLEAKQYVDKFMK